MQEVAVVLRPKLGLFSRLSTPLGTKAVVAAGLGKAGRRSKALASCPLLSLQHG
jgi:hypothetical protein